ncbi:hypothetical protein VTN96DRAFT_581 [Rasamsonia emersonii]
MVLEQPPLFLCIVLVPPTAGECSTGTNYKTSPPVDEATSALIRPVSASTKTMERIRGTVAVFLGDQEISTGVKNAP